MIDEKHGDCTLPLWLGLAKEDTPLFDQVFCIKSEPRFGGRKKRQIIHIEYSRSSPVIGQTDQGDRDILLQVLHLMMVVQVGSCLYRKSMKLQPSFDQQ